MNNNVLQLTPVTKPWGNSVVNDYEGNQPFWYGKVIAPAVGETLRIIGSKIEVNLSTGFILYRGVGNISAPKSQIVDFARSYYKTHLGATEEQAKERIHDTWNQVGAVLPNLEEQVEHCANRPKTLVNWLLQLGYGDVIEVVL